MGQWQRRRIHSFPSSFAMEMDSHTTPSSKLTQLTESLKLEHQFLRVPFEHCKKTIRANHRTIETEVSSVIAAISDAADSDMSKDDAFKHLISFVSRLQGLERKVSKGKPIGKNPNPTPYDPVISCF